MRPVATRRQAVSAIRRQPLAPVPDKHAPAQADDAAGWLTVHRAVSLVAVLGLLWPEFKAWADIVSAPLPGLVTILLTGATLALACMIASARTDATLERLDRWLLALGLLALLAWAGWNLRGALGYGTDEAAFVHGAAGLLLAGHDPYGASLLHSLATFGVPPIYWTYTMSGGVVSTLGYPALPVLVVAPFVQLFGNGQAVPFAEVSMLLVAVGATFAALPRPWKPLAIILCVVQSLEGFAVAGLNVVLMLPMLILVARHWTRVGEGGRLSSRDLAAAVALGLALSTNQLAWFIAPFLLVGILLLRQGSSGTRRAVGITTRFGAFAALTFVLVNGPFIVWGPAAWWRGVSAPLNQHAIPYGQGLIGLTALLGIGGGTVDAYTCAAVALYLGLLVLFAVHFRALSRCCFLLPVVALYASGRSLAEYWLALVAPIVVCAMAADSASLKAAAQLTWPRRLRMRLPAKIVSPVLFTPAVALLAVALLSSAPLSIQVLRTQLAPHSNAVVRLWAVVANGSDAPLTPHFAINSTGQASPFWRIVAGPTVLRGGAQARYVLAVTDVDPSTAGPFRLQAVTGSPRTISSSSVVRAG